MTFRDGIDIQMPGMDGLEATRRIKQLEQAPRVLVMTQHEDVEYVDATWIVGGDGFLSKKHLGVVASQSKDRGERSGSDVD